MRTFAVVIVIAGIAAFLLMSDLRGEVTASKLALPVLCALLSFCAAAALLGVAAVLARGPEEPHPELNRALTRVHTQLGEVGTRISELQAITDRISRNLNQKPATQAEPSGIKPSDLEPLYQALHEIRDLTLLPDVERRDRTERERRERRALLIKQSFDLVAARDWPKAERIVLQLETEYPNDDEVAKSRNYLNHARRLNETETVTHAKQEVERLMAISAWEDALAKARVLVNGFPDNGLARELLNRVMRERTAFEEINVQRMFEELRHDVERRMWRRAFMHAQRILERNSDHPRAEEVRRQLKTIQDNAEIEERQEQEVRIQELIKDRRFNEAIELAEDLIRRYPLSPQAESLETLLPRIRELARQGVAEFSGLSPERIDDVVTGFHDTSI